MKFSYFNAMAAGRMNPRETAAVAPLNWNASQMLGIKFASTKTTKMSVKLMNAKRHFSESKGLAEGKKRPSTLTRRG